MSQRHVVEIQPSGVLLEDVEQATEQRARVDVVPVGHTDVPWRVVAGRGPRQGREVRVLLRVAATPDLDAERLQQHGLARWIARDDEVLRERCKVHAVVDRAGPDVVVVPRYEHRGRLEPRDLVGGEAHGLFLHVRAIEEIAGDDHEIDVLSEPKVDHAPKHLAHLRAPSDVVLRIARLVRAEVHVRGVQEA